jgi:uncharacterized protein YbaA (DUF1428 family)
MPGYITYFVVPVPKKKLAAYKAMARRSATVWLDHGATSYEEWVADDVKKGKVTSFPQAVKLKAGEVVVVGCATYPSKAARDRCMKKVMADERLADLMDPDNMPFDGERMFWGSFKALVQG